MKSMTKFNYTTTHVGSIPHPTLNGITDKLAAMLDAPAWPQLPRRTFRENMYVQYSPSLPAIVEDAAKETIYFDTRADITPALEAFYTPFLADDVNAFALRPEYATGFFAMLETLKVANPKSAICNQQFAKGQVTGPISFGLTVTDQDLRASLYNEILADAILKNAAMNARWQVRQLKTVRSNVIIFVDEPYMASFGSAFISLSREQVIAMLDEVFDAIHAEGALAWGIVPNNEEIYRVTAEGLAKHLRGGIQLMSEKATARGVTIRPAEFNERSLLVPACGLGSTSVEIADRVFEVLSQTATHLRQG